MKRAFLSHSSHDADFVREVASLLGRYSAHIDVQSFQPGLDFRSEIRRALDDSDVFVFFVSRHSLESSWCQFELDEAELRSVKRTLRRSLAIAIQEDIQVDDLPAWLQRTRIVRSAAPQLAARKIEALLLAPEAETKPFLGRGDDMQRGIRKLATSNPSPRLLVATGLEGVGRRTYLEHLLLDGLSLEMGPVVALSETATLEDLYIECRGAAVLLTRRDAEEELSAFRSMEPDDQAKETAAQLALLSNQGSAPCIVDRNAMLDSTNCYRHPYQELISSFLEIPDVYLCIVHTRTPQMRQLTFRREVFERRLRALGSPDAQALISRLLRDIGIRASQEQTLALAEQIAGYPPAAYYLVSQVEDYGLELVLTDSQRLGEFHRGSFAGFIDSLGLSKSAAEILTYLSSESTLTLGGIAAATDNTLSNTATAIAHLIDHNLVDVSGEEYVVAPPIQATVLRSSAVGLNRKWYEQAFERLEEEFWRTDNSLPPISVVDATLRAGLRIGKNRLAGFGSLVRPSLLINAAQEMYHDREYERALEYVDRAQSMGGPTPVLLEVKLKSLAHLKRFGEARKALREYQEFGERRKWYLDGFIDRRARKHDRACEKFQRGYADGERSISLLRDYGDSLLKSGAAEQAFPFALEAYHRDRGDVFVLDLLARIAIAVRSVSESEEALDVLEAADRDQRFILQRRAWFLILRKGNAEAGRRAAALAAEACKRRDAPMEAYVAWARGLIIAREFSQVDGVRAQIKQKRALDSERLISSLDCHVFLEQGEWRRAEQALRRAGYDSSQAPHVRAKILDLKSKDPAVLLNDRNDAKRESEQLRTASDHHSDESVEELVTYE
jgi:TIR domain-containing protein